METVQNCLQSLQELLRSASIDYYVIKLAQTNIPEEIPQDDRHQSAEGTRGPREAKRHPGKVKQSTPGTKSGPLFGTVGQTKLPVSTEEVYSYKVLRVPEVIQGILDVWDGIGILPGDCIYASVINTKSEGRIFF